MPPTERKSSFYMLWHAKAHQLEGNLWQGFDLGLISNVTWPSVKNDDF